MSRIVLTTTYMTQSSEPCLLQITFSLLWFTSSGQIFDKEFPLCEIRRNLRFLKQEGMETFFLSELPIFLLFLLLLSKRCYTKLPGPFSGLYWLGKLQMNCMELKLSEYECPAAMCIQLKLITMSLGWQRLWFWDLGDTEGKSDILLCESETWLQSLVITLAPTVLLKDPPVFLIGRYLLPCIISLLKMPALGFTAAHHFHITVFNCRFIPAILISVNKISWTVIKHDAAV